ncbi:MAG: CoA activase [candidate division WOR-3 bacterium]|nr:MAG: CoA activase [candidate division WOR-3 bacterium]
MKTVHEYGIDVGSVSLKLAQFSNERIERVFYLPHYGRPYNLLLEILKDLGTIDRLILTGGFARPLCDILGAVPVNEVDATAHGVLHFHPDVKSIIEIGGEDSKLISLDRGIKDFASNTICAAGTGIFLDQQARRLNFNIEEFGDRALESHSPTQIAGRCSVFAKSDMIHLQQIGAKPEDLIAGLCLSLARNFKSVIAKGKEISTPVAFVGGVAANKGMVRAFERVLSMTQEHLVIPQYYNCIGAIGAILKAREIGEEVDYKGIEEFENWLSIPKTINRLPPLNGHKKWRPAIHSVRPQTKTEAYLGVDVGSISTNLVLIDRFAHVLARRYLWTKGRPIEVVLQGLRELEEEVGDRVKIVGAGTTGSGRYLIGEFIGADIIKNEISAQARAAIEIDPDVDTIFEIGGQDSKFISLRNKAIIDFEMNKVCAAGTGSFLEEQAQVLGVELNEFGDLALKARAPINLGERCTVFIGSEVIHHQQDSAERENLLAGLGYSIVFNYLNRVVSGKKIGDKIFLQGGVAANKAVIAAFEEVLGKKVEVPVNYDVTGAIGIALLVRDREIKKTTFKGFNLASKSYTSESFVCQHCSNECEVNKITIDGEQSIYYGGRCERYEEKEKRIQNNLPDLFTLRNDIFFKTEETDGIEIGIPRSLVFFELFPFFYRFLTELGFKPILSESTNRKIIELGAEISITDTCLPVKIALGHIHSLISRGTKKFFIPSVITMPAKEESFSRCFMCPYVQAIPHMARAVFGKDITVYSPPLYFDRGKAGVEEGIYEFARHFGKSERDIRRALDKAIAYQTEVERKIVDVGKDVLNEIEDFAFVICSRPYNGYDLGMNLNLPKKIRDLGVLSIPVDFIPLDYKAIKEDFYNMYWHYGQKILAAAETIRTDEKLFAVYLSNFACGPDSFVTRFFKEKLAEKPFLLIELDEHSGDAGFITRCEAFYDSIKRGERIGRSRRIRAESGIRKEKKIYIPDMCDGARVLASAMRYTGIDAEVLPPPDEESITIGRQFTSGRECLPAIITAGDMVKKLRSADFDPQRSAFFMAQGSGPCRFGQYYKLHRIILDDLGYSSIPVYAPNQGPSLFDDLGPLGIRFLLLAWDGICAVDGIEAKSRMIRPYEKNRGVTDVVYANALNDISSLIEQGKSITGFLKKVRKDFEQISIEKNCRKPRIGIVGEIYVRSQKFSNNFLINKLEELGCEVAMPSIAEWFFYTNFTRVKNCRWFRQHRRALVTKIFDKYMQWRQYRIYKLLGLVPENKVTALLDYARSYLDPSFEGEAIVTIGKTIEFIKEHFCGVVNVMPFTCMPSNIASTIYRRLKDDYPDVPLFVLSLDGLNHAIDAMRLETFISQARQRLKEEFT